MKILIVTAFFPPQNTIATQRPLSWARVWSVAGHDVTVLTVDRQSVTSGSGDAQKSSAERSLYRTVAVPLPGVFRWLRRAYKRAEANSEAAAIWPVSLKSRLITILKARGLLSSVRWPDMHGAWVPSALHAIGDEKFDVVISTFGPPAVISVGWALKRRGQAKKWIIDYRDLWTENPSFKGFPVVRWTERLAENYYLRRADAVTTVSQPLAETLLKRVKAVRVFPNGFEGDNVRTALRADQTDKKVIRYTGSLYWPHQDPTPLFKVLKRRLGRGQTNVHAEFYGPSLGKIAALAEELGVTSMVKVFGVVARDEALRLQREADALLFLESPSTPGREGILTGKLFEYLAARKPILAIGVAEQSLAGQIIAECDAGACVDDDEARIATLIEEIESDRVKLRPRGLPERFSRNKTAFDMLQFVMMV